MESRVALDAGRIAFYAKAADNLTPHSDPNWMMLFIDADRDKSTGWEGFDFAYAGKEIELSIPRASLGLGAAEVSLQFQWADNLQKLGDINEFFVNGDVAPDRRFHYAFASKVAYSAATRLPAQQGSGSGRKLTFMTGFTRESFPVPHPRERQEPGHCACAFRMRGAGRCWSGLCAELPDCQCRQGSWERACNGSNAFRTIKSFLKNACSSFQVTRSASRKIESRFRFFLPPFIPCLQRLDGTEPDPFPRVSLNLPKSGLRD